MMLKISKKIVSVILVVIMIFSAFTIVPFTASAVSYKDSFINALLENEDEWYENWGTPIVYPSALTFTDLNFDGKLEFIMQYGGGWQANCEADAYYFEDGKIHLVTSSNETANHKGFENLLTGYYDRVNDKYVVIGNPYCRISMAENWKGNFVLDFNGKNLEVNYYSSMWQNRDYDWNIENQRTQYYNGANGYADTTGFNEISESEYNKINEKKLENLVDINMKSEFIYCSDWENYSDSEKRQALEKAYDGFKYDDYTNGLKIYSDHTNLNVKKGDSINIGAGIYTNNQQINDISKLTLSVDDTSILSVSNTSVHDNCRFLTLNAKKTGTTYVTFSDSNTGYVTRVPITVYDNNLMAFTVSGVPTQNIEKYTTNFYNVNGLFVDSYTYSTNSDKTTTVSFDVYNTNYIYGAVEVYNKDGAMTDAVIIDKMTNNSGSIEAAVWDNTCCLVRDVIDGDLRSYRQESGYSKKTSVKVTIPENGYIKITTDTSSSFLVGLVNGVDVLLSLKSIAGDIKGFDVNSKAFADKITTKLVKNAVYAQFIKDEDKYAKNLLKNVAKKSTIFDSESLGNFADTFVNNLSQLQLEDLIFDTAVDFGWGVGESVFEYFAGPIGMVLKGMFAFGDLANLIIEDNHYIKSSGCGCIVIQNQGGGVRTASQVTVTSDTNFNSDTALKVFEVQVDSDLLDIIKKNEPELYGRIISGLSITYNISMIKDGKEVQPEGEVEVSIPIPENLLVYAYTGKLKIYRFEDNGTTTEMDVWVDNGCLVFRTSHFSLYSLMVPIGSEKLGDVNFDGKINVDDATDIQKYIASLIKFNSTQERVADVDGDGKIGITDVTEIQKYLAGLQSVLSNSTGSGNDDYSKIYTTSDFYNIKNNLSGKYILMNDISFENSIIPSIGTSYNPFTGILDGNGYTIILGKDDSSIAGGDNSKGLFGHTDGAEIKNLKTTGGLNFVNNALGSGNANYCGGIVGFAKNTTFNNCTNSANIISSVGSNGGSGVSAYAYAGGIAGWCDGGSITNCSNSGTIKSSSNTNLRADAVSGGLSGVCSGTTIKSCNNTGYIYSSSITSSSQYWALAYSGGLIGQNNAGSMSGCSNSGVVESSCLPKVATNFNSVAASGGLIGYGKINYESCTVNTNDITAENNSYSTKYTGQFIGYTP